MADPTGLLIITYNVTNFTWPNQSGQDLIIQNYTSVFQTAFGVAGGGLLPGLGPVTASLNTAVTTAGPMSLRISVDGLVVSPGPPVPFTPESALANVATAAADPGVIATLASFTSGGVITYASASYQSITPTP